MKNLKNINLLFLEDNITFAEHTIKLLKLYVKEVFHATNMKDALKLFETKDIKLIISDLKVEDGNALKFIEKVRQLDENIPIVVLSAHKDEKFLLNAIPLGLTYYAIKPIDFHEFESVLKRCSVVVNKYSSDVILIKDNKFYNRSKKIIIVDDEEITLSKKEAMFIELLIENKNNIISKQTVAQIIWEDEVMSESALKNFLLRVRKKVGKDLFYTIQNIGYRL